MENKMKLRINGNSVRLRVSRSELVRFLTEGRVENTIHFGPEPKAKLVYALESVPGAVVPTVRYCIPELTVALTVDAATGWGESDQVGIYEKLDIGTVGPLDVIIEKDFACLDGSDEDNSDTFSNPNTGQTC